MQFPNNKEHHKLITQMNAKHAIPNRRTAEPSIG